MAQKLNAYLWSNWLTWGLPLDHILSHINSDHIHIPYFFKINFNITFPPLFMSAKQCLPLRSCDQNVLCFVMRVLEIFNLASTVMQNMPKTLWYHQNLINGKKSWQSKTQSLNDQDTVFSFADHSDLLCSTTEYYSL